MPLMVDPETWLRPNQPPGSWGWCGSPCAIAIMGTNRRTFAFAEFYPAGTCAMPTYLEKLDGACEANQSLVCVGLDPEPARMPVSDVLEFNRAIVEATADLTAAYKPNLSFYEALGIPGLRALEDTIKVIRDAAPQAFIIGDAKRGDIGPSGRAYARAMFQVWGFDSVTVNAWGGADTLEPFLEDADRGIFIWCRGSNPGSATLQELPVQVDGTTMPIYERLAHISQQWNGNGNVGLVVGATAPDQLRRVRELNPEMPVLIPGVGPAQGGDLAAAVRNGADAAGRRAIINSSRGIIYASDGPDFGQAARRATVELREAINRILDEEGKGWR